MDNTSFSSKNYFHGTSSKQAALEKISHATDLFGESLDFCILTGSSAQHLEKQGSDLDVLTVIRPSSGSVHAVIEFANRQVSAQLEHGFQPDAKYPTDVISLQQLQAVVEGRAIRVLDGEFLLVPNNSEDRVLDYRIWLYELITHNLDLLGGDLEKLQKATRNALRTTLDTVKRDIFRPAGLTKALTPRVLDLLVQELNESGLAYVQGTVFSMSANYVNEQFKNMLDARMLEEPEYIVEWENFNTLGCGFARKVEFASKN